MEEADGSSIHYAIDGEKMTTFQTREGLQKDQALVVDLQVIYNLRKAVVVEQAAHECQACVLEASVDRLWWWPVHPFTRGPGEEVEWRGKDATPSESFPIVARYIRILATADEWREHKPYWGLTEFEVFGDELQDSLTREAMVWLEGGEAMIADDDSEDEAGAHRGPLSYATDSDTSTSFVTVAPPSGLLDSHGDIVDGIVIDLQEAHDIALIVIWQNETRLCKTCMIQKSMDGNEWEDIQLMVHTDGMVLAGFGPTNHVVARYIRLTVIESMSTPWEIVDMDVYGVLSVAEEQGDDE